MLVGSISGTGMHMMNNALQKVPLSRREFSGKKFYIFAFLFPVIIATCGGLLPLYVEKIGEIEIDDVVQGDARSWAEDCAQRRVAVGDGQVENNS